MKANEKCGIYKIECTTSGNCYVGSSMMIYRRWYQHRKALRDGKHYNSRLLMAWQKHGEAAFAFSVLEECDRGALESREQWHIDALKPSYNIMTDVAARLGPEVLSKRAAALRARALLITHCPKGHAYDEANTYLSKAGKRVCRACNAARVAALYEKETPEQREIRRIKVRTGYNANIAARRLVQREYAAAHKAEKQDYDRRYREARKSETLSPI